MTRPLNRTLCLLLLGSIGCKAADPPTCEEGEDTACFRGVFRTLIGAPIEGFEVCAPDLPEIDCTTTDEDGGWKLPGLPRDTDVIITAAHPDYVPSLFAQNTGMSWYEWYKVGIPTNIADSNAGRLDTENDPTRGHMLFLAWEGLNIDGEDTDAVPGVTLETAGGGRVFYGNALQLADPDRTETSSSGSGGVLNVPPGEMEVRLRAPAGRCAHEPMFHPTVGDAGWIPVPVRAGWTTAIDVMCPVDR
jgi:hypothetical protein